MYDNNDGKAPSSSLFLTVTTILIAIAVIVYLAISSGKIHFSKKEFSPKIADTVTPMENPEADKEPVDTLSPLQHQALDLVNRYFRKTATRKKRAKVVMRISEVIPWFESLKEDKERNRLSDELVKAWDKLSSAWKYAPDSPDVEKYQRAYDNLVRQITAYDDGFKGKKLGHKCSIYFRKWYSGIPEYAEVFFSDDMSSISKVVQDFREPLEKFTGQDGKVGLKTRFFRDTLVPPAFSDIESLRTANMEDDLSRGYLLVGHDGGMSRIITVDRYGKETRYSRWFDEITLVPPIDFGHYLVRSGKYVGVYDYGGYELMPVEYDRCIYKASVLSCFKGEKEYFYHNDRGRDSISKVIDEHMEVYMNMNGRK